MCIARARNLDHHTVTPRVNNREKTMMTIATAIAESQQNAKERESHGRENERAKESVISVWICESNWIWLEKIGFIVVFFFRSLHMLTHRCGIFSCRNVHVFRFLCKIFVSLSECLIFFFGFKIGLFSRNFHLFEYKKVLLTNNRRTNSNSALFSVAFFRVGFSE